MMDALFEFSYNFLLNNFMKYILLQSYSKPSFEICSYQTGTFTFTICFFTFFSYQFYFLSF